MRASVWMVLLLLPFRAGAEADPKTVRTWKAKCAACHGPDGKADTDQGRKMGMRSVATLEWQKSFTDDELRAATRDGIKRTTPDGKSQEMTGFKGKLTDAEIDQLVAYMRSLGPAVKASKPAETKPEPKPAEAKPAEANTAEAKPAATASDRKLWKAKCASCHGSDGKAKKGKATLDMTAADWQAAHDDAALAALLGAPRPLVQVKGKDVKHFTGKLKDAEVKALVGVVRSFR